MVGLDGVDDLRVLAVFLADVNADLDMAALDLVVKGLADVMQQTGAAGQLDIDTQLTGHQTGQPGHLERVAQDVLAEARAVLQAANELDKVGMQAVNAKLHDGLVAFALHLDFQLAAALVHGLLDAGRMDTAIGNQALQRHAGDLAAGLVKAGQRDGLRRVVDDKVTARGGFECTDVAALAANDTALHFVAGQRHNADGGLAGGVCRAAGDGLADQLTGEVVALVLHVRLVGADLHRLLVSQLVIDLLEQHGAGVLLGHGGDGFQLFGLAQLELLQLVQAGLHGLTAALEVLLLALHLGGALVEGFLLLVDAALLAGDLGAAVLDFLVRVALELEGFVLRFDDGFLALLLGSLDGIIYDALGFLLSAADLRLGGALAVFTAEVKTKRPGNSGSNKDQHHGQNW